MTNSTSKSLTTLLPTTSYELIYTLPLLFVSILLCFAGAFLTLDRTRSFPPHYDSIPGSFDPKAAKKSTIYRLEGGVGGLAAGYAFAVHCSTFLSLLIPGTTSSPIPSPKTFAAIWVLSVVFATPLAGRWKYTALAFMGLTGGALLGVALGIIVHPSMLFRMVLPIIFAPALMILALIPHPLTQRISLRVASSHAGAFGIVLAIAIFTKNSSWEDAWDRLWIKEREDWGSGKEKGLSAAFCLLTTIGGLIDWALKRKFGECPDEKWDAYLTKYSNTLPNLPNRAGTFRPLTSFWDRLFPSKGLDSSSNFPSQGSRGFNAKGRTLSKDPLLSHYTTETSATPGGIPLPNPEFTAKLQKPGKSTNTRSASFSANPAFLKKIRSPTKSGTRTPRRAAVKFRAGVDGYSSDEAEELDITSSPPIPLPILHHGTPSGQTRVDDGSVTSSISKATNDVTRVNTPTRTPASDSWVPEFIKRSKSGSGELKRQDGPDYPPEALGAVPATPSLVNALERVATAQKDAFKSETLISDGLPADHREELTSGKARRKSQEWDGFWKDVLTKAKY